VDGGIVGLYHSIIEVKDCTIWIIGDFGSSNVVDSFFASGIAHIAPAHACKHQNNHMPDNNHACETTTNTAISSASPIGTNAQPSDAKQRK